LDGILLCFRHRMSRWRTTREKNLQDCVPLSLGANVTKNVSNPILLHIFKNGQRTKVHIHSTYVQ
jgi:hypothetical protein